MQWWGKVESGTFWAEIINVSPLGGGGRRLGQAGAIMLKNLEGGGREERRGGCTDMECPIVCPTNGLILAGGRLFGLVSSLLIYFSVG